jgi:hypothetical protein
MANTLHTVKRDEVGKRIQFTLSDADGVYNLDNWTVTMNLKKGSTVVTSNAAVTKETQTGSNIGKCYHAWAANTIPDARGDYKGELKLTNGSNVLYWPTHSDGTRTYFTVRVQDPLA